MNNKKNLIGFLTIIILLTCASKTFSQSPPPALQSIMENESSIVKISIIENATDEQKKYLLDSTEIDAKGYLKISVSLEYLNMIADLAKNTPILKVDADVQWLETINLPGIKVVYDREIPEDEFRKSIIFNSGYGQGMITIWNYKKNGAKIFVFREFINTSVSGMPATISLSFNKQSKKKMWKLYWWNTESSFELYLEDSLNSNDNPPLTTEKVKSMGEAFSKLNFVNK